MAVALTTSTVGCDDLLDPFRPTGGDPLPPEEYEQSAGQLAPPTEDDGDIDVPGIIAPPENEGDEGELGGKPLPPEDDDMDEGELGGEPAIEPEDIMGDMPV